MPEFLLRPHFYLFLSLVRLFLDAGGAGEHL